jgi:hypothetical protein
MCVSGDPEFKASVTDHVGKVSQTVEMPRTLESAIEKASDYHRAGTPLVVVVDGCRSIEKARKQLAAIAEAAPSAVYLLITPEHPEPLLAEFCEIASLGIYTKEQLGEVDRFVSALRRHRRATLL